MNKLKHQYIHNKFKLNGVRLSREEMVSMAIDFIKEGKPFEQHIGKFLLDWFDAQLCIHLTTSGTTGAPKIITIKKKAMIASAMATGDFFGILPGNSALHCLPSNFIAGKMMWVRSFVLGLELFVVEPNSQPLFETSQVFDFCAMVPLQAKNSLEELKNKRIRKLIIGGAGIDKSLKDELIDLSTEVFETYGMTETVSHIAVKKIGSNNFVTLPNITVSQDERNCLIINAKKILQNDIVTNDVVTLISNTQFVWQGRYDNVINSGGVKLFPEQIEDKLLERIQRRFFIFGQLDQYFGQKAVLYIEGESFELEDSVFDILNPYEKPKEIIFVSKFKETPSGKIKRNEIANLK